LSELESADWETCRLLTRSTAAGLSAAKVTNWLYGLEGDIMGLNYHPSDTETVFATVSGAPTPAFNMLVTAQNRWLTSIRGRLGWVVGPVLLYGTAGMAFTSSSYTATAGALPAVMQPVGATATFWDTKTGYMVGGGAEWMLTPNWLLRAEYLHYGFDSSSSSLPLVFATATEFGGWALCRAIRPFTSGAPSGNATWGGLAG
jgi:opacity protein-like surface antigen